MDDALANVPSPSSSLSSSSGPSSALSLLQGSEDSASDSSAELVRRVGDASDNATHGSSTPSEPHMSSRGLDPWARRPGLRAGPDPRTCLRPDDDPDPSQGRQLKSRPPLHQRFRAAVPTHMVREAADAWLGQLDEPSRSTRKRGNSHLPLTAEGAGQQRRRG